MEFFNINNSKLKILFNLIQDFDQTLLQIINHFYKRTDFFIIKLCYKSTTVSWSKKTGCFKSQQNQLLKQP